ncbi:RPM1-interacting protein 4-like isoform X3 [Henckelia pumila]|uniref:RPM1-interacting protein 4-like isoform X3 n=1 Tax=Henckelia pumila TaxID=405737 RepID=UPI003C6E26F9
MDRPHVPKFGNWDGENVPYTACFENARKEKGINGIRMNPNDPQQNPEAFDYANYSSAPKKNRFHKRNTSDQLKSGTFRNASSSASGSDKTASHDSSVNSILKPKHGRRRSDLSQIPPAEDYSCRSVAVPKFGEWDEKNPSSAEGFTVIFNKVKEEKQIAAAKFPSATGSASVCKYHEFRHKEDTRGKVCTLPLR